MLTGLVAGLVFALGCGSGRAPEEAKAHLSGNVTYEGKAVTGGKMTFHSKTGKKVVVPIGAEGQYVAPDLPLGEIQVSIETESAKAVAGAQGVGGKPGGKAVKDPDIAKLTQGLKRPAYMEIPAKYASPATSGLTVTVTTGKQQKDFQLTK
jgi:hypothetical protein